MTDEPTDPLGTITDEMNRARGAYLSVFCTVEMVLDSALLAFFEVPAFRKQQLARGSLLDRCGFTGKVDTLEYILKSTRVEPPTTTLVSDLREANSYRNVLAHAAIGPRSDSTAETIMLTTVQFKKGRPRTEEISPADVNDRIPGVNELFRHLVTLTISLAQLDKGDEGVIPFD